MKIIKMGEKKPIQFECKACGCIYEATTGEYKGDFLFIPPETPEGLQSLSFARYWCKCPCCNEMNSKLV